MAGPCASVFVSSDVEALDGALRRLLIQVSEHQRGNDCWVCDTGVVGGSYRGEGRPFLWRLSPSPEWDEDPNQHERGELEKLLGAAPRAAISLCAMCNDDRDHRVLGELCLTMARQLNGIVRFDGLLTTCQTVEEVRAWRQLSAKDHCAMFLAQVGNGGGILAAIGLDPEDPPAFHYADARFMEHWLAHPKFRMVK